jgi:hypothetical protein
MLLTSDAARELGLVNSSCKFSAGTRRDFVRVDARTCKQACTLDRDRGAPAQSDRRRGAPNAASAARELLISGEAPRLSAVGRGHMLWTIIVILFVLWLLGLIGNVGGSLIHLLLVLALIVLIFNVLGGRRTTI